MSSSSSKLSVVRSSSTDAPSITIDLCVRDRIAGQPVRGQHATVAQILSASLDPAFTFHFVREYDEPSHRPGRILNQDGSEVAANAWQWLRSEMTCAADRWRDRYRELLQAPLIRTDYQIRRLYFAARSGPAVSDFFQALVYIETEYPAEEFVPEDWQVKSPQDVWEYSAPDEKAEVVTLPVYRLQQIEHIGSVITRDAAVHRTNYPDQLTWATNFKVGVIDFDRNQQHQTSLRELHRYPDLPPPTPLQRWFMDWARSSAGCSGALPEHHWFFSIREGVWKEKPFCEVIPGWATRKKLPDFSKAKIRSVARLVEWLEAFDVKAGHPFAWYFFMLHGNRIERDVGFRVVEAIRHGLGWLSESDRKVLLKWAERSYGF